MPQQAASEAHRQPVGSLRGVQQALIVFGFALAGVIVGLVGYGLWVAHDRVLAGAVVETARLSRIFEQHAAQTAEVVDRTFASAARTIRVRGSDIGPLDPYVSAELSRLLSGAPQMIAISVLDRAGRVVQDSRPGAGAAALPMARADIERQLADDSGDLHVSGLFPMDGRRDGAFALSRRLMGADGGPGGVIVAYVDAAYFKKLYQQLDVGTQGVIMLLRDDGTALVR
ncbi:MAG: hypothetical protein ACREEV_00505, partial [Dongiaceae bacterium]